jgi:hypothetical protein
VASADTLLTPTGRALLTVRSRERDTPPMFLKDQDLVLALCVAWERGDFASAKGHLHNCTADQIEGT